MFGNVYLTNTCSEIRTKLKAQQEAGTAATTTSTADMTNFHAKTNSTYHQINVMFRGDHESQTQMITT